jgi:hypothetical protein
MLGARDEDRLGKYWSRLVALIVVIIVTLGPDQRVRVAVVLLYLRV